MRSTKENMDKPSLQSDRMPGSLEEFWKGSALMIFGLAKK